MRVPTDRHILVFQIGKTGKRKYRKAATAAAAYVSEPSRNACYLSNYRKQHVSYSLGYVVMFSWVAVIHIAKTNKN